MGSENNQFAGRSHQLKSLIADNKTVWNPGSRQQPTQVPCSWQQSKYRIEETCLKSLEPTTTNSSRQLQFYTSIVVGYKGLELVVVGSQDFKPFCCRLQGIWVGVNQSVTWYLRVTVHIIKLYCNCNGWDGFKNKWTNYCHITVTVNTNPCVKSCNFDLKSQKSKAHSDNFNKFFEYSQKYESYSCMKTCLKLPWH